MIRTFIVSLLRWWRRTRRSFGIPVSGDELLTGPDAKKLGEYYEGLRNDAYPDPGTGGDPWTCGIGCTGHDAAGNKIVKGTYWDTPRCYAEYGYRMDTEFGPGIKDAIVEDMTQKEFDSMLDLAYNIGVAAFAGSTLVKKFNAGDKQGAADEFPKWNKAGGNVMKGLERRRWAERHVFLGGTADDGIAEAQAKYP